MRTNNPTPITKIPDAIKAAILVFIVVLGSLLLKFLTIIGEASFVTLTCVSIFVGVIVYFKKSIQSFSLGLTGVKIKLKETVDVMVAKETEPPPFRWIKAIGTDIETKQVIKALGSDKYTWRYLGGIAQDTNLPLETINKSLDWLILNKLAVEAQGNQGKIWGLSPEGRSLLSNIRATENASSQV